MDLADRVRAFVIDQALFPPKARLLLGVSGGPDSLCLLDVLTRLAGDWGLSLSVACLDHGLRPEAAGEAAFVRQAAEARGWPFFTEAVDTRAWAAGRRQSVEEAARELRYAFLARAAGEAGAPFIAVGHTADDQAETVLMHFLRGSGLAGLRGMPAKALLPNPTDPQAREPRWLVRPLLGTTRPAVEAYCGERGLHPREDASNRDTAFFRNRLRHELLPALEAYNPNIRAGLARSAAVLAGEHELLQAVVAALWKGVVRTEGPRVEFHRDHWLALSLAEQRALLRQAAQRLLPDERDVDFAPIDQAARFSRRAVPGRSCDLLRGLRLKVTADAIVVGPWDERPAHPELPLLEAGRLPPPWRFAAEPLAAGAWSPAQVAGNPDPWCAYVDAERLPAEPLELRGRRPGDRFQPLGLGGHSTKLADFLINNRIEAGLRDRWPLAAAGGQIVWVAGLRLDERCKVTEQTRRVVRLSLRRVAPATDTDKMEAEARPNSD
ncbi:MAG: tRNA lysidine(34) synthetase TilS [Anaerolineales bacterium]|nr:tRNA lysidine(34) synthetase TilS [Anaerolineales bacterium]